MSCAYRFAHMASMLEPNMQITEICVWCKTISSENNRLDASSGTSNNEQRMSLLKITEKNNTIGDMQLELMTEMNQFEY